MRKTLLTLSLGVLMAGVMGGYALGGYATGEEGEGGNRSWWASEASASPDIVEAPVVAQDEAKPAEAPSGYVCHGCGPTLAERRSMGQSANYLLDDESVPDTAAGASHIPTQASHLSAVDLPDLDSLPPH